MCFSAPEVFIHSVARRTREHTKCVPSRRSRSPFCEPGGRGRTPHPFYGFFCLRIGSTIKNVRGGLVRSAAFPAPRFSDLISAPGGSPFCEPGKRGRSCMPFRLAFDCPPQIFCRFLKNIFGFLHSGRQHSSNKPGAEAPRLKDFLFHNHLPKTRQLRFILHAFGTRPVRIRAPRPIGPHRTQLAASAHTQCIPSRRSLSPFCKNRGRESTHSVFHRGHKVYLIAPHTECVSPRRRFSFIPWRAGRGRMPHPFCGFPRSAALFACKSAAQLETRWMREHAERVSPRRRFSFIPWCAGRKSTPRPFCGVFVCESAAQSKHANTGLLRYKH